MRPAPGRIAGSSSRLPSSAAAEGFVVVGRAGKPHGRDGSFVVENASDEPSRFALGAVLWVGGEPTRVLSSKRARGLPVIRLDRPVARGADLSVPVSELPPSAEGSYYVFQLVGLRVVDAGGRALGRVTDVSPGVANDVLELDSGLSLPMHEECVSEVDLAAGTIVVAPGFADHDYPR